MEPTEEQLKEAVVHISFEMNRYLYTARPVFSLPGRYAEIVTESCLLHSRTIGEFFFGSPIKDDISISHYLEKLISNSKLKDEIEKSKSKWEDYKKHRLNKKLMHLTYAGVNESPTQMQEKDEMKVECECKKRVKGNLMF